MNSTTEKTLLDSSAKFLGKGKEKLEINVDQC